LIFAFYSATVAAEEEAKMEQLVDAGGALELADTVAIPLLGLVAAGEPYQAFAIDETLSVPTGLWGGKTVFALRVRGNSMIDEGIRHGDYLIVEPRASAENGQTVVAEIDGCVTVKKYYRETDGAIRLQPANPEMLPLRIRASGVRIIGVVTGILRKVGFAERSPVSAPPPRRAQPAPRPASVHRPVSPGADGASLDLALNVVDRQLVRWTAAIAHARQEKRLRRHVAQMEELSRDLQALRDWCARTHKPGLRRALLAEANKVIRRMQRFASVTPVELPDLVLH
jgi:repressor LexA